MSKVWIIATKTRQERIDAQRLLYKRGYRWKYGEVGLCHTTESEYIYVVEGNCIKGCPKSEMFTYTPDKDAIKLSCKEFIKKPIPYANKIMKSKMSFEMEIAIPFESEEIRCCDGILALSKDAVKEIKRAIKAGKL
jgi:hypothetical protein